MIKTKTILSLALLGAMPVEEAPTSPDVGVQMSQQIDWSRRIDFQSVGAHKIKMPEKLVKMFQEKADKMVRDNFEGCDNPPSFELNFLDTVFSFVFNVESLFNKDMPLLVQTVLISIRSKILYDLHNEAQNAKIEDGEFDIVCDKNTGHYTARSRLSKYTYTFPITGEHIERYIQDNNCNRLNISKPSWRGVKFAEYISAEYKRPNYGTFSIIRLYERDLDGNSSPRYSFFKDIEFKRPTKNVPPTFEEPIKKIIDRLNEHSKGNFADPLDSSFAIKNFSGYQLTRWLDQGDKDDMMEYTLLQFTHTSNKSILEFMIPMCNTPHILISIKENIPLNSQEKLTQAFNERQIDLSDIRFIKKIDENTIEICIYKDPNKPYSAYTLFVQCDTENLISKDPEANNREYIKIGDKRFEVVMIDDSHFEVPASDYYLSQSHQLNAIIKAKAFDLQTIEKNIEDLKKELEGAQSEEEKVELKKKLDEKIEERKELSFKLLERLPRVGKGLKDVALAVQDVSLEEVSGLFETIYEERVSEQKSNEIDQRLNTKITAAVEELKQKLKPQCEELIKHTLELVQAPLSKQSIPLAKVGLVLAELLKMKIAAMEQVIAEGEGILEEERLVLHQNEEWLITETKNRAKTIQSKVVLGLALYISQMIERGVDEDVGKELHTILEKVVSGLALYISQMIERGVDEHVEKELHTILEKVQTLAREVVEKAASA